MVQPIVADAGPPPGDNPGDWQLHRWTLRYQRKAHAPFPELEASFQARQSVRYAVPLRVVTVLFFAVNVVLVYFDWVRFMSGGQAGLGLPPRPVDPAMFSAATAIRLGGMLPLCVAIIAYSYTTAYTRNPQPIALLLWLLGNCLIAYTVVGSNPGYGVLALMIVYVFGFTPLNVFVSAAMCSTLVVTFGVAIGLTRSRWEQVAALDTGIAVSDTDFLVQMVNILGVLVVFTVIVGFVGHNLEYWLRLSFLDEVRLTAEKAELEKEKRLSEALLVTMVPPTILAQLQAGHTMVADSIPEASVLFCQLHLDVYRLSPDKVVRVLNMVYSAFDALTDVHGMHKIETVGDVYLCVAGCPTQSFDHAASAAAMALSMRDAMPIIRKEVEAGTGVPGSDIDIRIGINSGPVAAGVVGIKQPR